VAALGRRQVADLWVDCTMVVAVVAVPSQLTTHLVWCICVNSTVNLSRPLVAAHKEIWRTCCITCYHFSAKLVHSAVCLWSWFVFWFLHYSTLTTAQKCLCIVIEYVNLYWGTHTDCSYPHLRSTLCSEHWLSSARLMCRVAWFWLQ